MQPSTAPVAWITGASSGIGEALTYLMNDRGYRLIISARKSKTLNAVRERCQFPENVSVLPIDLAEISAMPEKVKAAIDINGGIDILVNNAGISQRSLIAETTVDVYARLMDINYLGTIALTKALLPHYIEKKAGHYVTVTSLMGKFGSPLRSGYCAAKHALHGFFDVLRMEHEKDGVAVTLICPGFVQTNIARNALTGSGLPQDNNDAATEAGMSSEKFARKMLRAIKNKKQEAYIGGFEVNGVYLKRFFPRLLHKVVLRSRVV